MNTPNTKPGAFTSPPAFPMPSYLIEQSVAAIFALGLTEEKQQELVDKITDAAVGMTLRDYFAAQVIGTLLDHTSTKVRDAEEAYKVADAMMEARKL